VRRATWKDCRNLSVGEKAHSPRLTVYIITAQFPQYELEGLTSQLVRCAVAIGVNIAEGWGKRGKNEFQLYLQIAYGSARPVGVSLVTVRRLGISLGRRLSKPGE
jgi:four helix bundle protein